MTNIENQKSTSRRNWLTGSAAVVGAGAVSAFLLKAQSTGTSNDINILNFALRLENLEAAFYVQGLAMFTAKDFQTSATLQTIGGTKIGANIYSYLQAIGQHELDHVTKLVQTITSLGGTPQPVDCYNFGIKTPDNFLLLAQALENTGVTAYDGAVASIQDPNLQTAAATIATIEARHAAYLNVLNLGIPFPAPFDTTQTMAQVLAIAGQFLTTGCPTSAPLITRALAGPTKKYILTTNQSTVKLDASNSTSVNGKPLTYLWNQVLGSPMVAIQNDSSQVATATLLGGPGTYSIALRVVDTFGNNDDDELKIVYAP